VQGLLAPVLGEDNYKLSVTAAVDNDRVEETREQYGDAPKVTNEATRDEQDRSRLALGVPGSLSNRPVAIAAEAASGAQDDAANRRNASTRQFAYDRTITQIKRGRGQLHRLSVAVALNAAAAPDRAKGWTPDDIAKIERLLRSGLGLDATRGDELVVSALAFPARPAPQPWWQDRDTQVDIGTNAALGDRCAARLLLRRAARHEDGRPHRRGAAARRSPRAGVRGRGRGPGDPGDAGCVRGAARAVNGYADARRAPARELRPAAGRLAGRRDGRPPEGARGQGAGARGRSRQAMGAEEAWPKRISPSSSPACPVRPSASWNRPRSSS
jgi:flagellar M-ring protein FliF